MAKLAFSKLQKNKTIPEVVDTTTFEGCELRVKQYLPLEEKLQLLTNVLELSGADEGYFNLVQLEVFYQIEVIKAYTNISFTDKQLENPTKLYDSIYVNRVWEKISAQIPKEELDYLWGAILNMAREITEYNRSFVGMLKTSSQDYTALDLNIEELRNKIKDPELLRFIPNILPEVGLND